MAILSALNSRCTLSYKLSMSPMLCKHLSPVQTSLKPLLRKQHLFLTSSRHFSWDGFYSSISSSTPVLTVQNALLDLHNFSGLPWWAVIMLTTLGIRSIFIFPLAVHQNQVIARLMNIKAELGQMAPELQKEVAVASKMHRWDESASRKVFKRTMHSYYKKFVVRDNCHPSKIVLLALFQVPIWICFSVSLRNLTFFPSLTKCDSQELQQQFKSEGTLWFKDLTSPDSFIIPFLLAFVNITLIEIHNLRQLGKPSKFQKYMLYAMRFIAITVAGAAAVNPSSVSFYWLCSSTFGIAQIIILMSPRFRHILRIPSIANMSLTPYKDIASNFRKRFLS